MKGWNFNVIFLVRMESLTSGQEAQLVALPNGSKATSLLILVRVEHPAVIPRFVLVHLIVNG